MEPARRRIRKDVDDVAPPDAGLHLLPELDRVDVAVLLVERPQQLRRQPDEAPKLLGKNIPWPDAEPRLLTQVVVFGARRRNRPEHEVGEQSELVVVVADDAAVPGDAEVL